MKKNIFISSILCAITCCAVSAINAQIVNVDSTTNWRRTFKAGLNINQASFSNNWKAGGVNSVGLNTFLNYKADYAKDKNSWNNEIDLHYGMVNNQGQGYRKTIDRVFIDSKYGYQISKHWDFFTAFNAITQFAKGYQYIKDANGVEQPNMISQGFSPIFATVSVGVEYHPVKYFKIRISPLAPRITILGNNDGRYNLVNTEKPYGVKVGSSTRYEWAAFQILMDFNKDIAPGVNLTWRYVLFANYETFEANKIDHRVDLALIAKVTRFINVSLNGTFLYDYDQDQSIQLSQAFSLGVLYTYQNFKK